MSLKPFSNLFRPFFISNNHYRGSIEMTEKRLIFKFKIMERGWTQSEFAKQVRISDSLLSRFIQGYRNPTDEQIKMICEILGETQETLGF